jgi:predicted RNA-binding protein with PUA-like domain
MVDQVRAGRLLRHEMSIGDRVLFHHSESNPPAVVGIAEVASEPKSDHTQFDPSSKCFDEKSDPDDPRWWMRDMRFVEKFPRMVGMLELRSQPELAGMVLLNRSRPSIQPVTQQASSRRPRPSLMGLR